MRARRFGTFPCSVRLSKPTRILQTLQYPIQPSRHDSESTSPQEKFGSDYCRAPGQVPAGDGIAFYIPPQLSFSHLLSLRCLRYLYFTISNILFNPQTRFPWSRLSPIFATIFSTSASHLHLFPLPRARIRNIITRYPSSLVFDKLNSAVYLIWSPFSRHFYIGSFDRNLDTCAYRRFTEHLKCAFHPRSNSTACYFHTRLRLQPGVWCISILKANPNDAAEYERYAIKTLHPTLNKPPNNMLTKQHQHLPMRFRNNNNTTNIPHSQNKFIFKPTLLAQKQPIDTQTANNFTSNLSQILDKHQTQRHFHLYPGNQTLFDTTTKRLLAKSLVTLERTSLYKNKTRPLFHGLLSHLLPLLPDFPPLLFTLIFL